MPAHDPNREELYRIAGDPEHGMASTMNLTRSAAGHPQIRYRDKVITADVYIADGRLMVHLICPRCLNALKITDERKKMEYDARDNVLSVEPFACPWEMSAHRTEFGVGMCRWTVGIDRNVARDA